VQISSDLDLTASSKGQVVFGYFCVSALASAWAGRMTERFGPRRLMRLAAVCSGVSAVAIAAAQSFAWILAAVAIGGLANALAQPAANALVVHHVPVERRGFALGVKQSAIPMATLLAGLAVPAIGLTIGWRWAFVGGGAIAVSAAWSIPAAGPASALKRSETTLPRERIRPLLVLALGSCLGAAMANVLGAFTTSSAVDAGVSAGAAGALLALASAVGLGLRLASGRLADRRGGGHVTAVALMLVGGGIGIIGMASDQVPILVLGTLLAFGSGWSWPGVFNLAVVSYYPKTPAAATGVTQTGSYAGGAIGPLAMGYLVEHFGYDRSWLVFAAVAVAGAVIIHQARRLFDDPV
jgi:MFS family permease